MFTSWGVQLDQRSRQGDNEAHPWVIPPLRMPDGWNDICVPDGWAAFHKTRSWKVIHAIVLSLKWKCRHFYENFITGTGSCHFDNLRSDENLIKRTYLFQVVVDGYLGAMMSLNRIISHENKGGDYPSRVQWEHTLDQRYFVRITLQWRHNERDGVSNHQPHHCLLNRLFKAQIKENVKAPPRHWPLCWKFTGDRWIPSVHKGPVTRKIFPFDGVIMQLKKCWFPAPAVNTLV